MSANSRKSTEKSDGDRERQPARPITDEVSFEALTSDPRQIAALYFYLQMDHVVCAAYRASLDAVDQTYRYTSLRNKGTAGSLARLRARYGHDEQVPDRVQRAAIYLGAFGETAVHSDRTTGEYTFPDLRDALLNACAKYAERVYDTGVDLLLASVRTAHLLMQAFLLGQHGDSLVWSVEETLGGVTRQLTYPLLHDPGLSAVFGITTPPAREWPFREDANADKLLEQMDRQLPASPEAGPDMPAPITRASSSNRQRAAIRGAEAIAAILEFPPGGPVDQLIDLTSKCYLWATSLNSLAPPKAVPTGPEYAG
jgi:hypothetical protein